MQPTGITDAQGHPPTAEHDGWSSDNALPMRRRPAFRRFLRLYLLLLAVLLLAIVPPLISVNRLQRRIATSIGASLGRPVHLDRVTLNLLPLPGFTLENFVVSEDPAFGSEPVIRASTVRATLRVTSLWRRRVEFSSISLADPSVNLVHNPDGRWNLQSILLQASRILTAPTAQKSAGPSPRFPYIEATGARINLKNGAEKTPFCFTEAEFALWLPTPEQWRLRLTARPLRTDTSVSDTGVFNLEGTLRRAASLGDVPIDLTASWRNAPLGQFSRVLSGHDAGWRGDIALSGSVTGTIAHSTVHSRVLMTGLRRADFVPERTLSIDAGCVAQASNLFHSFSRIRCSWPPEAASGRPSSETKTLALTGDIPDIHHLDSVEFSLGTPGIPAATLLEWLRVLSSRALPDTEVTGSLTGSLRYAPTTSGQPASPGGDLRLLEATLRSSLLDPNPISIPALALHSALPPPHPGGAARPVAAPTFLLLPMEIRLGGKDPATLEGNLDSLGYTLHLSGAVLPARLLALARSLPQFGEGLDDVIAAQTIPAPIHIDLTATRPWGGAQSWLPTPQHARPVLPVRRRRR